MIYRQFGKIGKISALGFGCMRLPEITENGRTRVDEDKAVAMLRRGYELGINYFDTAVYYCNEQSETTVGKAIKPFRDKIMLSSKCPMSDNMDTKYYRRFLEQSLRRLDTDHLDVYHFHAINKNVFDNGIMKLGMLKEAQRALDEGLIKHVAFSFHDKPEYISYIIERGEGIFDSITCQYNLLDRANEEQIAKTHERGMGVIIMGPVGGGRLGGASALAGKLEKGDDTATPELALRFVLGNNGVSAALSGMSSIEQLEQNAAVASDPTPMTPERFERVNAMLKEIEKFNELYCTGCEYCLPCPKGIQIPKVFRAYNMKNVYGLDEYARANYARLNPPVEGATPVSACIGCKACMKKCPQHLEIPALLKKADAALRG